LLFVVPSAEQIANLVTVLQFVCGRTTMIQPRELLVLNAIGRTDSICIPQLSGRIATAYSRRDRERSVFVRFADNKTRTVDLGLFTSSIPKNVLPALVYCCTQEFDYVFFKDNFGLDSLSLGALVYASLDFRLNRDFLAEYGNELLSMSGRIQNQYAVVEMMIIGLALRYTKEDDTSVAFTMPEVCHCDIRLTNVVAALLSVFRVAKEAKATRELILYSDLLRVIIEGSDIENRCYAFRHAAALALVESANPDLVPEFLVSFNDRPLLLSVSKSLLSHKNKFLNYVFEEMLADSEGDAFKFVRAVHFREMVMSDEVEGVEIGYLDPEHLPFIESVWRKLINHGISLRKLYKFRKMINSVLIYDEAVHFQSFVEGSLHSLRAVENRKRKASTMTD
jgi:hypothetical protein